MKKYILTAFAAAALLTACVDLELSPKSQGSSENWYSSAQELELSLNGLYRPVLWYTECFRNHVTDRWSDDWSQRTNLYDWLGGAISDNWGEVQTTGQTFTRASPAPTPLFKALKKPKTNSRMPKSPSIREKPNSSALLSTPTSSHCSEMCLSIPSTSAWTMHTSLAV